MHKFLSWNCNGEDRLYTGHEAGDGITETGSKICIKGRHV